MSMAEERVIKIGMLGLGTVGTGVYKVLKSQQEEMLPKLGARVELKKILVRNVEKAAAILLDDFRNGRLGRLTLELPEEN